MRVLGAIFAISVAIPIASATTYLVRPDGTGDYPTIQAAIDGVSGGDVIELADGTFTGDGNRDVSYLGKEITVRSQSGDAQSCIIDCEGSATDCHRAFVFESGEGPDAVLEGVTITNGFVEDTWDIWAGSGGAIRMRDASPRFSNVVFSGNTASMGGAVYVYLGSTEFSDCSFVDNTSTWGGTGGIWCIDSELITVTDCVFIGNIGYQGAGGLSCGNTASRVTGCWFQDNYTIMGAGGLVLRGPAEVSDCTFASNRGDYGAGGASLAGSDEIVFGRCTFWGNSSPSGPGGLEIVWGNAPLLTLEHTIIASSTAGEAMDCGDIGSATLTCCDLYGNEGGDWIGCIAGQYGISGNISEDPMFCDPENGDFHLDCNSPCAPFSPPNPECDLIGAWPVGCGGTPTLVTTWGEVKALFRREAN